MILIPNTAYGCVRKTVTTLKDRYNVTVLDVNMVRFRSILLGRI